MSALLSAPSKVPKNTRLCELFLKPYDGKPPWQNGAFYLGSDVFVVSYASCHSLARRLTDKTLTISKAELDDETAEHSGAKLEGGISGRSFPCRSEPGHISLICCICILLYTPFYRPCSGNFAMVPTKQRPRSLAR